MHVGIISYQTGHLKTWQILKKLLTKTFDITLYAFPFVFRPQERDGFQDRPFQLINIDIKQFCSRHKIRYIEVNGWQDDNAYLFGEKGNKDTPDVFLTCTAKIIPQAFISDRIIINAHPGLLPENRGLDAFKWSIVNDWPVGISLHVIDKEIDKGVLLHRMRVPILPEDTLIDVANRSYKIECDLQSNFDYYLKRLKYSIKVTDKYPLSKKEIPKDIDTKIEELFLEKRERFVKYSHEPDFIDKY